jgi:ADP-ribose pyrophosphatase YjhB (NUDIX family)
MGVVARTEYVNDPNAPHANTLVVAASAVVVNDRGGILLHRRSDNAMWSVPGGAMELGETIAQTVIREVKEETGLDIAIERLVGIYSDPGHVVAYSDGEVRQQFSICFAGRVVGGQVATSAESLEIAFVAPDRIAQLPMGDPIRLRIQHYLEYRGQPVIA